MTPQVIAETAEPTRNTIIPALDRRLAIIAGALLGIAVCSTPVCILSLSVFMKPLSASFGWGRGEIALALSVICVTMAIGTPIAGRLIDRIGVRPVLLVSLFLYAIGLVATPVLIGAFGLPGLYVAYAIIGFLGAGSNTVAYVHVVSGWFDRSRGFMLGLTTSGIALGSAINPVIAQVLISDFGWATGFYGLALLPVLVGLPVALFLIHEPPHVAAKKTSPEAQKGLTAGEALKTRTFWILMIVFLLVATGINGTQIHIPALFSDRGFSPAVSVSALSFLFVISAATRISVGYLIDRLFAPYVGLALFLLAAIGAALLVPQASPVVYFAAAAGIGLGAGAETDLLAYLVGRYFGLRSFGEIYGWLFGSFMIGSALGPFLLGLGFDMFGSYKIALSGAAAGLVLACALLALLPRFPREYEAGK